MHLTGSFGDLDHGFFGVQVMPSQSHVPINDVEPILAVPSPPFHRCPHSNSVQVSTGPALPRVAVPEDDQPSAHANRPVKAASTGHSRATIKWLRTSHESNSRSSKTLGRRQAGMRYCLADTTGRPTTPIGCEHFYRCCSYSMLSSSGLGRRRSMLVLGGCRSDPGVGAGFRGCVNGGAHRSDRRKTLKVSTFADNSDRPAHCALLVEVAEWTGGPLFLPD